MVSKNITCAETRQNSESRVYKGAVGQEMALLNNFIVLKGDQMNSEYKDCECFYIHWEALCNNYIIITIANLFTIVLSFLIPSTVLPES